MHANEPKALPEAGAIQMLIDELLPTAPPAAAPRNGAPGKTARTVLGAHPLRDFWKGVNWTNAADYQSPFTARAPAAPNGPPRRVLGAIPLREFLAGVDWGNAARPAPLDIPALEPPDHARMVLDTFMNEINWD